MSPTNKILWLKKEWHLKENPFPAEAIARLGGDNSRENGLLFNPAVQGDKVQEAVEKFVLGAAYSGIKFGYLWSLGTGMSSDARGFGKSSLMQYLVETINIDFGEGFFKEVGLEKEDAAEHPMCAVLASFDMANARSLNAVFYEAARYACRFRNDDEAETLAERIRGQLIKATGSEDPADLIEAVEQAQESLRGRTLGPPVGEFLELLCADDSRGLQRYVDNVTPTKRTRSGAQYLATFLVMAKAAGIKHVILCCDQLEDFAATTTTRQKRTLETERFRDYILELQPMSDMLSCVVTLHPRATQAIGEMWRLADLPDYDPDRNENQHRVVVLDRVDSVGKVRDLLTNYISNARTAGAQVDSPMFPFTDAAIETIYHRSDRKPRDILRKAHALVEQGSEQNWKVIDDHNAASVLDSLEFPDEDPDTEVAPVPTSISDRWG
jgi:hypothetical protein